MLAVLDGRELEPALRQAAELLATVVGQDLNEGEDGVFRIARKVAKDRVISTSTLTHGMVTRPRRAGLTAIRGTSRSTQTAR